MKYMKRSEVREHIFRMIFQVEFTDVEEQMEQVDMYLDQLFKERLDVNGYVKPDEGEESAPEMTDIFVKVQGEMEYMKNKAIDIFKSLEMIDGKISEISKEWKINRLGKAELAILRLAVYEVLQDDDIPERVAINEAVELAKKYGSDQAPKFINGVLAQLV